MRVAFLTPLPPVRSGIAQYAAMLLPTLSRQLDVTAVVKQLELDPPPGPTIDFSLFVDIRASFDAVVCQLGNNLHHEFIYDYALQHPSIIVLHDLVLHHLIAERTVARGDADAYVTELRRSEGAAGAAYASGRAAGFHLELASFLLPAVREIAERSLHVIVHNEFARRLLLDGGVTTPITVVSHPYQASPQFSLVNRKGLGYADSDRIVACLGFITEAKQPAVVLEAFARAAEKESSLRLLFVGEPSVTVDLESLIAASGVDRARVRVAGYVSDADFDAYIDLSDAVVNLRYPSAGEASGPLVRVLAAGKPVAVSDYAQFAEFPDDVVTRIPLDSPSARLTAFMLGEEAGDAVTRKNWITAKADVEEAAALYARVITETTGRRGSTSGAQAGVPLFAELSLRTSSVFSEQASIRLDITVRNNGTRILRARDFGTPVLNILARALSAAREVETIWIPLPSDLEPGAEASMSCRFPSTGITRIELFEALTSVPFFPRAPLAVVEVAK